MKTGDLGEMLSYSYHKTKKLKMKERITSGILGDVGGRLSNHTLQKCYHNEHTF